MLRYDDLAFHSPKLRARMIPGWELDYFNSEEWLNVQDVLDERDRESCGYTPDRRDLFRSLRICSHANTDVLFMGQDPYPNPKHATGIAFSVPVESPGCVSRLDLANPGEPGGSSKRISKANLRVPPSLFTIFQELTNDLRIPWPRVGSLEPWCKQGVLLWNAMPVCPGIEDFKPLTQEIVERLSGKGKIIFVLCGRKAQEYAIHIDNYNNRVIYVSHPSPRGQISAKDKFVGSRIFSTINAHLNHYCKEPIDWIL